MMKRAPRFLEPSRDIAMRLCVGDLAVPSEDLVYILGDSVPHQQGKFILMQGARSSFHLRWLEQSLNLKKGSLSLDKWPLGREMIAAKDAAFGERKGRMKRVSKAGSVFPKKLLFQISVRGTELPCLAPRRNALYVECTIPIVRFLVEETVKDLDLQELESAPLEDRAPRVGPSAGEEEAPRSSPDPVEEGEEEDPLEVDLEVQPHDLVIPGEGLVGVKEEPLEVDLEVQPHDLAMEAVSSAMAEIKSISPGIQAAWHPSRSSICVSFRGRKESFLAPSFSKSCKRGDAQTPLATAVQQASAWIEGHMERPMLVPLAGPSAAAPQTQES